MQSTQEDEHWIPTDLGRIYAKQWHPVRERSGDTFPIVLLHDSLGCVELWRDFPARLAQATGHVVIAYDRLGFGKSDSRLGALDADFIHAEARRAFAGLRKALGVSDFGLFGHSVGGGMAVGCAAAYPSHCRALITESAQAFVEDRTVEGIRTAQREFADPQQVNRLKRYHGDKAAWVLSAWIDSWLAPDFASWSLDDALRRVQSPVLAIHGDRDEYGSVRHPKRIVELASASSTLCILQECGHVPHRERPEQVLALVQQ